jgi:RNA polymerase sigma-70 factor, ECF subfamily
MYSFISGPDTSQDTAHSSVPTATQAGRTPVQEASYDAILVGRFNAGDETAFVEIMKRYQTRIFNVSFRLLHNHADAEEIAQDTFLRAHRALARFRGDCSLHSWLYRIATNLARNRYWYFFRRRRQDSFSLDQPMGDYAGPSCSDLFADSAHDPAQAAASREFSELISACTAQLATRQREILNLHNVLNRSYQQIATTLGINVGTVKSRIARARSNLRALLAAACPEFGPKARHAEWFIPTRASHDRSAVITG